MKKAVAMLLVGLMMVFALAGCGARHEEAARRTIDPPRSSTRSETAMASSSEEIPPEVSAVQYPGERVYFDPWIETAKDGYDALVDVKLWQPVELNQTYVHPAYSDNPAMVIPADTVVGYEGESAWAIAFSMTVRNETEGFGSLDAASFIGTTKYIALGTDEAINYVVIRYSEHILVDEEDMRGRGDAYVAFLWLGPDGSLHKSHQVTTSGEIAEGSSKTVAGFIIVVDARKTPNTPTGVETGCFTNIAAGWYGGWDYDCHLLIDIVKDTDGSFKLQNQYEFYEW